MVPRLARVLLPCNLTMLPGLQPWHVTFMNLLPPQYLRLANGLLGGSLHKVLFDTGVILPGTGTDKQETRLSGA